MMWMLCAGSQGRAIVIGEVDSDPVVGQPVRLRDARMVLYWSTACGGLLGLAGRGPREGARITAPVPEVIESTWQTAIRLSAEAAAAVRSWPEC